MKNISWQKRAVFLLIIGINFISAIGQSGEITGSLKNKNNNPVMYATVSMHQQKDSVVKASTITNDDGLFAFNHIRPGQYFLKTSYLGFRDTLIRNISITPSRQMHDCGIILLKEKSHQLEEIQCTAVRLRGKSTNEKTSYTIKSEMKNSSHNGTEILQFIPGIQVDLKNNVYLEGDPNVIVLVNGRERDQNYLNQLQPAKIDRIEVSRGTSSKYEADAAGVINIILKKDKDQGIGGFLNLEIPITQSATFIHPSASLSYGKKKISMLLNYNGSFQNFDILSRKDYLLHKELENREILNQSNLEQKNYNHKINLSIDYFLNDRNSFSLYTYYNPYKNEFAGHSSSRIFDGSSLSNSIDYSSKELDKNTALLLSLYYKHTFNRPSTELTLDLGHYNYAGNNEFTIWDINQLNDSTLFSNSNSENLSKSEPERKLNYIRIDFTSKLAENTKMDCGAKYRLNKYSNGNSDDFNYSNIDLSAYTMLNHRYKKFNTSIGLRLEYANSKLKNGIEKDYLSLLPYFITSYKLSEKHKLRLSFNRSLIKPGLYDLIPGITSIDLYSAHQGNPNLQQGKINKYALEYSSQIKGSYLALQIFYRDIKNRIHLNGEYTIDNQLLLKRININSEYEYGFSFSGSISLFKFLSIMPYLKIYNYSFDDDTFYHNYTSGICHESSISAIFNLKYNLSVSFMYQNNSPRYSIQNKRYQDNLYFVSIDKKIGKSLKLGISSAVPFQKDFTYDVNNFKSQEFQSDQVNSIDFRCFPLWFKISYNFSSGSKIKHNKRKNSIREEKKRNIL